MAPELILHHYDFSCFSEKVRLVLGMKGLRWRSVSIPPTLPKPDYMPLTRGYRRAPALQIGADVFCDSVRIIEELAADLTVGKLLATAVQRYNVRDGI